VALVVDELFSATIGKMPANGRFRVAVIGGGISGLAAAYRLAKARAAGQPLEEHLFEAQTRLGGVIHTDQADGCLIEAGPDSFLSEKPQAFELARELGLAGDVVGSDDARRHTYILHRGKLATLPDGLMFLVPTRLLPMLTTPLVPFAEKVGMLRELFRKPQAVGDESVAGFVERHFGRAMVENIADPLLAGVYGGSADELSIRATLPRFADMEQREGSLIRAVLKARRKMRRVPRGPLALFSTLENGLAQFTRAIEQRLEPSRVHCGAGVAGIRVAPAGGHGRPGYDLVCQGGLQAGFDALILALPAHESARLLSSRDPELAAPLAQIPYSSSMTVAVGYHHRVRRMLPPGFGFLVPRREGPRLLACTFVHAKFPSRVPPDRALLRCFLGGSRDEAILNLDDEQAARLVLEELRQILGLSEEPLFVRVYRWRRSMAQYAVGHLDRVAAIHQRLRHHPGTFLAGNWESGIGISDCIRSGQTAASNCLRYLAET